MEFVIRPDRTHFDIINTIWSILYESFINFEKKYSEMIDLVLSKTNTSKLIFPNKPIISFQR